MLHSVKKLTAAALLLLVAAYGCKKEDKAPVQQSTTKESTAKENTNTAKTWLAQQQAALAKSGGAMQLADAERIDWDNPIGGTDGNTLFVSVATDNQQLGKYLKITKDANGAITGGNYVYLYPTMQKQTNAYLLEGKAIPADFNGTLLEYGLNNQLVASKVYEKGNAVVGKVTKLALKPVSGKGDNAQAKVVCYAYYMQTFVNGLMVTEVYLYTVCYGTPDATLENEEGGGGVIDETAALMAEFNNHIKKATPMPVSITTPETTPQPDPISFTHTWAVAEGALGGWKVLATTRMDYYHKKFYDIQLNAIEHRYEIIFYKTIDSHYSGSNTFVTTTWTQTAAIDNIYNNNTPNALGKSQVFGNLKHRANFTITTPLGSIPPESEDTANNVCTISPK